MLVSFKSEARCEERGRGRGRVYSLSILCRQTTVTTNSDESIPRPRPMCLLATDPFDAQSINASVTAQLHFNSIQQFNDSISGNR